MVDGVEVIQAAPAADGRFTMTLPKALSRGQHQVQAMTANAAATTRVTVGPITPPADAPYRVTAADGGWQVDWITPGGGPQTTLLPAAARAAP
jgi:cytoskeletal protein RodZ